MKFMCYTIQNFMIIHVCLIECVCLKCKIKNKGRHVGNVKLTFCQINVDLIGLICEFYAFDKGFFVNLLDRLSKF